VDVGLFREDLTSFANTSYFLGRKPSANLWDVNYHQYRNALRAAAEHTTRKHISPHALRHSSATFYAGLYRGDRIKLAERYGWSYSAQELDTYVRRQNGRTKESAKITYQDDLLKVQRELSELKAQYATLQAQMDDMDEKIWAQVAQKVEARKKDARR
jgi:hypothetical protein